MELTTAFYRQRRSVLSFCFAAATVCHCMFDGASAPPQASGLMWSTTYPGQRPLLLPVEGHGFARMKSCFAAALRLMRPLWLRTQPTHFTPRDLREELGEE